MKLSVFWVPLIRLLSVSETLAPTVKTETTESEYEGYTPGTLTCILFGTKACDASCQTVAEIYGVDGIGICDKSNFCDCDYPQTSSLDILWSRKFDPRYVLPQIKLNYNAYEKALKILNEPFMSAAETAHEIQNIITPYQYMYLRIKPHTPSQTIPKPDGKFDHAAADRFTVEKLHHFITEDYPKGIDYKKLLLEALKTVKYEDVFQHILHEVRHSHNPILNTVVDEYLKSSHEQEDPLPQKVDNIIDFVDYVIINKLIDHIENPSKPKPKRLARAPAPHKFGPTPRSFDSPSSNIPRHLPRLSTQNFHDLFSSSLPSGTTKSLTNSQYSIPGLTKQLIDGYRGSLDKIWTGFGYRVHLRRNIPPGDIELEWKKGDSEVYFHKFPDNFVHQLWMFGRLTATTSGYLASWPVWRSSAADAKPVVVNNTSDEDAPRIMREAINAWCEENAFLVGGYEFCVLSSKQIPW